MRPTRCNEVIRWGQLRRYKGLNQCMRCKQFAPPVVSTSAPQQFSLLSVSSFIVWLGWVISASMPSPCPHYATVDQFHKTVAKLYISGVRGEGRAAWPLSYITLGPALPDLR